MNGPGHYREAEKLAEQSIDADLGGGHAAWLIGKAQVHATLALAAAMAESHDPDGLNVPDWTEVTR